MNKEYDLYKIYGLTKLLQETEQLQEQLLKEVFKELDIDYDDWFANFDIHYNNEKISIEEVKNQCDGLIETATLHDESDEQ